MRGRFNKAIILMGCVAAISLSKSAQAGIGVDLVGTGTYSLTSGTPTATSALGIPGGGVDFNIFLGSRVAAVAGLRYITEAYTTGVSANQVNAYIGSLGFRAYLTRALFTELGVYYSSQVFTTQGLSGYDFGGHFGLGVRIPISTHVGFIIDPRFDYSLREQTYNPGGKLTNHMLLLNIGFSFGGPGGK